MVFPIHYTHTHTHTQKPFLFPSTTVQPPPAEPPGGGFLNPGPLCNAQIDFRVLTRPACVSVHSPPPLSLSPSVCVGKRVCVSCRQCRLASYARVASRSDGRARKRPAGAVRRVGRRESRSTRRQSTLGRRNRPTAVRVSGPVVTVCARGSNR